MKPSHFVHVAPSEARPNSNTSQICTKDESGPRTRFTQVRETARRIFLFGAVAFAGLGVQLATLGLLHRLFSLQYTIALGLSVLAAMTFNFLVHNVLTFGDRRLRGLTQFKGWLSFCLASGLGGVLNMSVATGFFVSGWHWAVSGLLGAAAGGLVNYALASRYTWKPGEH